LRPAGGTGPVWDLLRDAARSRSGRRLGQPLEHCVTVEVDAPDARQDTLEAIHGFLRADKALAPESADAIHSVLRAAYAQLPMS
jgi:hypothetical protein